MTVEKKVLVLPKVAYGSICNKILHDFIEYHKLPKNLPKPEGNHTMAYSLSCIFDIMLHSMGKKNRHKLLKEAEEFFNSLPPSAR